MAQELVLDAGDVQEEFFDKGWTDGLPVVPPTPERVQTMLDHAGLGPADIVGNVPERSREVTAEKAAVNAVMAGCRPEYFPVVLGRFVGHVRPPLRVPHGGDQHWRRRALCGGERSPGGRAGVQLRAKCVGSGL